MPPPYPTSSPTLVSPCLARLPLTLSHPTCPSPPYTRRPLPLPVAISSLHSQSALAPLPSQTAGLIVVGGTTVAALPIAISSPVSPLSNPPRLFLVLTSCTRDNLGATTVSIKLSPVTVDLQSPPSPSHPFCLLSSTSETRDNVALCELEILLSPHDLLDFLVDSPIVVPLEAIVFAYRFYVFVS